MNDDRTLMMTRRGCVGGLLALGALPVRAAVAAPALWVGTYVAEGGAGVVPLRKVGDAWGIGAAVAGIRNASFAVGGARGLRYVLDEQQKGGLGVYDRGFRRVAVSSTLGADPCHAALSPDGGMLAAANYSSGSVALWTLDRATGLPKGPVLALQHKGSGPNKERQAGPHAHWVGFTRDGRTLHSVDLGADAIFAHRLGAGGVTGTDIAYRAVPGSGPRHLARHPHLPVAYLVAELANTITVLRALPDGRFVAHKVLSTVPAGYRGESYAGHIAMNAAGTRLYVSNRGHDSIATFAIDGRGELRLIGHVASGGHWPRYFRMLEASGEMLVANQRSGDVARLPVGRDGVVGRPTQVVRIPSAVFIGI
ncbi:6-phosphogluconolactonase [Sphingomonas endophytica]|uniref:6-phosphogluconolactonase n=1 Tax=Sphingomonas endophytica TaxID=869719 RepID=A0ABR6N253_9SPHN|nr:lactonase family protein [Sphingomonas endophytica]MBB5724859.1 6-phosphogluconolactonase [Sphingomonas endophytica]